MTMTLFPLLGPSTTLPNAGNMTLTSGGSVSTKTTKAGTALGFGEIFSQSSAAAWPALGAIGNPSGHGYLYDVTALENMVIPQGLWTPKIRMQLNANTATIDLYTRFFVYHSLSGLYSLIVTFLLAASAFTTSGTNYVFTGQTVAPVVFRGKDKLYQDVWCNVTASTMTSTGQIGIDVPSGTQGSTQSQLVLPSSVALIQNGSGFYREDRHSRQRNVA